MTGTGMVVTLGGDHGDRIFTAMRETDMYIGDAKPVSRHTRRARQDNSRGPVSRPDYDNVLPAQWLGSRNPQNFERGLFCRQPRREMYMRINSALAVRDLFRSEPALHESITISFDECPNPGRRYDISSCSDYHVGSPYSILHPHVLSTASKRNSDRRRRH